MNGRRFGRFMRCECMPMGAEKVVKIPEDMPTINKVLLRRLRRYKKPKSVETKRERRDQTGVRKGSDMVRVVST